MINLPSGLPLSSAAPPRSADSTPQAALFQRAFAAALSLDEFLARHGADNDRRRWRQNLDRTLLTGEQEQILARNIRRMPVLCMAAAWCGDCARQCPAIWKLAAATPFAELRLIDRDALPELAAELRVCGAPRVPQTVWLNEDFEPVVRGVDKTLSQYREQAARQCGSSCSAGIALPGDARTAAMVHDWFLHFELAGLILLTSSRLMDRHGMRAPAGPDATPTPCDNTSTLRKQVVREDHLLAQRAGTEAQRAGAEAARAGADEAPST